MQELNTKDDVIILFKEIHKVIGHEFIPGIINNGDIIEEFSSYLKEKNTYYICEEVSQTGGEGQGDYYQVVYRVGYNKHNTALIAYDGYYDSKNGVDWGKEFYFCAPKEVISTVYVSTDVPFTD